MAVPADARLDEVVRRGQNDIAKAQRANVEPQHMNLAGLLVRRPIVDQGKDVEEALLQPDAAGNPTLYRVVWTMKPLERRFMTDGTFNPFVWADYVYDPAVDGADPTPLQQGTRNRVQAAFRKYYEPPPAPEPVAAPIVAPVLPPA